MKLPAFPDLSPERLDAVLARHNMTGSSVVRLPSGGIFNAIFAVGDHVILRVPREHPDFAEATRKEALAVPTARSLGLRTPALLAFDDALDLLPVPYGLYERVPGEPLELLSRPPIETPDAYREVGRDLARLHDGVRRGSALDALALEDLPPPDSWPDELAEQGYLGALDARWLASWLAHLRDLGGSAPNTAVFRHGDMQATNVMVLPTGAFVALLDWGACGWGDAAHDFAGMPLAAVPFMLEGYRDVRGTPSDDTFEARIVARQLHLALFLLRRGPQPDKSWAERPLGMLLDLVRTLVGLPDPRWRTTLV
ncbi:phosphotransferase family protein [Deinococcus pimensis]|uniref:phosphotransferase family protein n=1 Tax=Deinococcus pimensis TaxID=309888 RepID=UPI000489D115|nr:aminoglycoside phosphotransferase family protein [Deinococcus pimensis]